MDIKTFKNRTESTKFNTNNGWGFGGSYGKIYSMYLSENLFKIKEGKNCYRHSISDLYKKFYINDCEVSKKFFEQELKKYF